MENGLYERVEAALDGYEGWIEQARYRRALSGVEALAIILWVIGEGGGDGRKIVSQWAGEIQQAIQSRAILARDPDSLLTLDKPAGWDWRADIKSFDSFLHYRGMGWDCGKIVEHLYARAYPADAAPPDEHSQQAEIEQLRRRVVELEAIQPANTRQLAAERDNLLRLVGLLSLAVAERGGKYKRGDRPAASAIQDLILEIAAAIGLPDDGIKSSRLKIAQGLKSVFDNAEGA